MLASLVFAAVAQQPTIVDIYNDFGFRLLAQATAKPCNAAIGAPTVAFCAAMALNGATGETATAIAKTLGIAVQDLQAFNNQSSALLRQFMQDRAARVANLCVLDPKVSASSAFTGAAKVSYGARLVNADLGQQSSVDNLNSWVKGATNGKIESMLGGLMPETRFLLASATYFKGRWQKAFSASDTASADFATGGESKVKCKMMSRKSDFRFAATETNKAVSLPFVGQYDMAIVLGTESKPSLPKVSGKEWSALVQGLKEREIVVSMPRFKMVYGRELRPLLEGMGMGIAFSTDANFDNLSRREPVCLTSVLHRAIVDVDEVGAEAAAATVAQGGGFGSGPPQPMSFAADRPFLFVIYERTSGAILFLGSVIDPTS